MRWSAAVGLALCLLAAGPAGAEGPQVPTEEARAAARELAEVTGVESQVGQMLTLMRGQMVQMIQRGAPGQTPAQVEHTVDDVLLPEFRARLGELKEMTAEIFVKNYTLDDMRELRAFYATPLGQRLLKVGPLIGAQSFAVGRKWGEVVANDAFRKNAEELRRRGVTL